MLKISKNHYSQKKNETSWGTFKIILFVKMKSSNLNNNYSIEIPTNLLFNYYDTLIQTKYGIHKVSSQITID
jgi:hypothetical protein